MAQFTTQLTIVGNLTRDPEVRYTQSGQAVASFSVASTPRSFNKDTKEYEDGEPIFTNCTLWGKPAENFAASAAKGKSDHPDRFVQVADIPGQRGQRQAGDRSDCR